MSEPSLKALGTPTKDQQRNSSGFLPFAPAGGRAWSHHVLEADAGPALHWDSRFTYTLKLMLAACTRTCTYFVKICLSQNCSSGLGAHSDSGGCAAASFAPVDERCPVIPSDKTCRWNSLW